jgi:hypothetical protein
MFRVALLLAVVLRHVPGALHRLAYFRCVFVGIHGCVSFSTPNTAESMPHGGMAE